jgi:hypothetical protein
MAGVTIDPSLAGFSTETQQGQQAIPAGGVVIDPSMVAPMQQEVQQVPRPEAPSGFKQGAGDPLYAVSQLIAKGLEQVPENVRLGRYPVAASARAFNERVVPERESVYQRARAAAGEEGFDYGRLGGNIASGIVPGMAITKGVGLVAPASRGMQAALSGGVSSALMTPVESSTDFLQNKIQQAGAGAALGYGLDKTLGAVVSPAMTAAGQKLKDLGVTLTPGQAFGGIVQTAEDLLAKLPVVGSTARSAQERALQEFNTSIINKSLSNVGKELPKGTVGRDAINYLYKASDDAYEDVLPKVKLGGTLDLYKGLGDTISTFTSAEPKYAKYLNDFVGKRILDPLSKGDLPGRSFKDIDTQLGKDIQAYSREGGDGAKLASALKDVQGYLRQGLRAVNPDDAPALDAANRLFSDRIRIEKAAGYLGADEGVFNPQQLMQAVKAADASVRKGAFARGNAQMQDVAEAGMQALGRSGAVKPTQVGGGLELGAGGFGGGALAAGGALPLSAALPLAPLAFYTSPMQNLFNAAMMGGRPSAAPALRQQLPAAMSPALTGGLLRDERIPRIELTGMAR